MRYAAGMGRGFLFLAGAAAVFVTGVGCGSAYTTDPPAAADDAGTDANGNQVDGGGSGPDAAVATLTARPGWATGRFVALTSDAPDALTNYDVLVVLQASFPYASAAPSGDDLRFQLPGNTTDLPYFIETWTIGGESHVWVRVPRVPTGKSVLAMYYGNPSAMAASSFPSTFPGAVRTAGAGLGSTVATASVDADWYELRAGDTLTVPDGVPWKVSARRVIVAGQIVGDGKGYAGGVPSFTAGAGPGAGQPSPAHKSGSSGGGYGGAGGIGGADVAEIPSTGGIANGTKTGDEIDMGSGGGAAFGKAGGAGGGAITLLGWKTTVSGGLRVDGAPGQGLAGQNAGGGSGGGVLVGACYLDMSGATIAGAGGAGGACGGPANDCGGGGGGGRVKLRRRPEGAFVAPASTNLTGGAGGSGGGSVTIGKPGADGITDTAQTSTLLKGVTTTLGDEQKF